MKQLSVLLRDAGVPTPPAADPTVSRVDYDSRSCRPGSLFVAVSGFHADGHAFAADAVAHGAVAVVAERPVEVPAGTPVILVEHTRPVLALLADSLLEHPSRGLLVAGVTGTDGKTTTCTMLWAAWRAAGITAGSLTTVDWRSGDGVRANKSRQTTLEAPDLQAHLAALGADGCTHVALETSSHALALHRVDGTEYRAAVYTRITSEHLELHGTRDAYLAAKARLLHMVAARPDGIAVLDATDAFATPVLMGIPVASRFTYSIEPEVGADLVATDVRVASSGVAMTAATPWGPVEMSLQLAGRFNAANALAALATACATGAPLKAAVRGIERLDRVPGRMERIDLGQPFSVVVDYAHTAEALATALSELRPSVHGRLWVVFGSAGERDLEKRPAMGRAAATLADVSVITDEDPRGEDRLRILEDIAAGATAAGGRRGENVVLVPDRAEAIWFAVSHAAAGDVILCAGKGHEASIIAGTEALPWDERAAVEAAIRRRLDG